MAVEDVIEGLNIYRAVEACGEHVLRQWADTESDPEIRRGFETVAEREGNHARALRDRVLVLGGEPGPACVDAALADFIEQAQATTTTQARLDLFNALVSGSGETAQAVAECGQGIRTAMEQGDPDTQAMLQDIFADEKLSIDWLRSARASAAP